MSTNRLSSLLPYLLMVIGLLAVAVVAAIRLPSEGQEEVQVAPGETVIVDGQSGQSATVVAGPLITRLAPNGTEMACSVVSLVNTGDQPWSLDTRQWSLSGPDRISEIFSFSTTQAPGLASGPVPAGAGANGDVCFDAPGEPGEYRLIYQPDSGRDKAYVWVSQFS